MQVMGGLQRESATGDVVDEGVAGGGVGGGAVGGVSGAAGDRMVNGDAVVVEDEGDIPLVLPVGRVLQVVPWAGVSMVLPMVMALPVVSIVRVLHRVAVRLVCAAAGVTVQVVVRLGAPSRGCCPRCSGWWGVFGDVDGEGVADDGPGDVGDSDGERAMAMPVLPMGRVLHGMQRVAAVRVLWAMHLVVVPL